MVRNVKWLSSLAAHNQRAKTSAKQRMDLSLIPSFDKLDVIDQESVQFDIRASSVVERLPVILPEPSIEEKQFEELQEKLSLFQEATFPDDFFTKSSFVESTVNDNVTEMEDIVLGKGIRVAPRITKDDESGDMRSLNRKLAERLYFIVKDNGKDGPSEWDFPDIVHNDSMGRKMKDFALFASRYCLGGKPVRLLPIGNAPMGHASYFYKQPRKDKSAAKVFFYKSQLIGGDLDYNMDKIQDYRWVTRTELKDYFDPEYYEYVQCMLPAI